MVDSVYYTREFEDFLIDKYKENPVQKGLFNAQEYINNFWKYFIYVLNSDPNIKYFLEYQLESYDIYRKEVAALEVEESLLGFKVWKSVNRPSQVLLDAINNHYFYDTYALAIIDLKIEKSLNEG